jgi:transcriptional regulator with XRE-family HTH domain
MPPTSPTVASWALGLRLREKREELSLTGSAAGKQGGIAPTYLSDVEHGKKKLAEERLEALIKAYEFDQAEAEELRELRQQATQRGWWNAYSALFGEELLRFFGYEHGAETLHTYDSGVLNGLLQTEDYARAVIEAGSPNLRLAEVDRRLNCRMIRQRRIIGDDPLRLNAVVSEAVLRQQIGGPEVLADQLRHLATLIDRYPDTIEVRVVPFEATGHPALGSSAFYLIDFPQRRLPTVLWQESVTSAQLIVDSLTVREYSLAHAEARKCALSREDSLEAITKAFSHQ